MFKKTIKILAWVILTIAVWAFFDIWIHDYGIMPYYKYGMIESARNAYLYGFWSLAVLNVAVIAILAKAWRYFIAWVMLMVSGAEDVIYYLLLPIFNPQRANQLSGFMPEKLPWLNANLWLKWLSGGAMVNRSGVYLALLLAVAAVFIFLFFSFIPNLFYKEPLPESLPQGMEKAVSKIKSAAGRRQALETAYSILTNKYRGYKFMTYLKLWQLWETDVNKIWQRSGFLHCTTMNYLLRILLVKSGWFQEEDLRLKYAMIWYVSLHQYLEVRLAPYEWIKVDIWYHHYGKGLGDYGHGFHA